MLKIINGVTSLLIPYHFDAYNFSSIPNPHHSTPTNTLHWNLILLSFSIISLKTNKTRRYPWRIQQLVSTHSFNHVPCSGGGFPTRNSELPKSWPNFLLFFGRGESWMSRIGCSGKNEPKIFTALFALASQIVSRTLCVWRLTCWPQTVQNTWKHIAQPPPVTHSPMTPFSQCLIWSPTTHLANDPPFTNNSFTNGPFNQCPHSPMTPFNQWPFSRRTHL